MAKFGSIKEIQYYEEREIDWKINDFPSIAEDKVIQSETFSFAGSTWYFALVKQSIKFPGFSGFGLCNVKPWEYTVKYDLGFRKHDGSVDQLSEGFLKGDKDKTEWKSFFFNLPTELERECEVALNVFTITCTLRRESNDCNQPSLWNKRKLIRKGRYVTNVAISKDVVGSMAVGPFMTFADHLVIGESVYQCKIKGLKAYGLFTPELDTLSENFKDLIAIKDSCDTTLLVQEKEYRAHRAVLIARSSVFAAMFLHETSEKQTGIVTIPDCDPESFEEFLKFLYCGKLEEPSPRSVLHLYETSDKYDVQELKKFCVEYLLGNLTVENFCDVVIFADQHEEVNLMSVAQGVFNKNLSQILQTSEWDCLVKRHYRLSKRFFMELSSKIKIVD